ncbi:MAG: tryptophan synthase subunit alpha [Actinomycetia bacterium]|nr:tryptophan synthase subunit alpha [Actinomycetes bacterium]
MTALSDTFARLAGERPALVGYFPAGFPDVATSIRAIEAMVESGVDIVEVGLPYSDPVMDGPTIQAAADKALSGGVRTRDVFEVVRASSSAGAATVVMTYWNPIERYGVERFAADLSAAGGSGMITPDLIPEEAGAWIDASVEHDLDRIFLVSPSSNEERLAMTAKAASGFIYATAVMGVTGARAQTSNQAPTLVSRLRGVTDKPIGVGLGVSNGDQAAEVGAYCDAVIVGSAIVRCLLDVPADEGVASVRRLVADLRAGVERARDGAG